MSDLERPYLERRPSGPPSSCPVCGAATRRIPGTAVITCSAWGRGDFEWHPTPVPVESERVVAAADYEAIQTKINDTSARMRLAAAGAWPVDPRVHTAAATFKSGSTVDADNQPYVNSLSTPLPQPRPEGYSCTHTPRCRDRRDVGDPEWSATELACGRVEVEGPDASNFAETDLAAFYEALRPTGPLDEIIRAVKRRMHDAGHCPTPLVGEVLGRDFVETAERRLHPDAAALASLHRPVYGRPPYCWTCSSAGGQRVRVDSARRAVWPCSTAELALEMMNLSPSDIAITKEE